MSRSRWKMIFFSKCVWRKIYIIKQKRKNLNFKRLKYTISPLFARYSNIPFCFKGFTFNIHKGKSYREFNIDLINVGYKFGDYAFTRKLYYYPFKKKKKTTTPLNFMGQINLPVLNRTGYSSFWQSVWDEKHNFNRGMKEDFLVRKLIPYIFLDSISKKKQFISFKLLKNSRHLNNINFWSQIKVPQNIYPKLKAFLWKKNIVLFYILKICIIKFQTWIVLYFSLYTPLKQLIFDKTKKYNFIRHMGYYHLFLSSIQYNKQYYNKNLNKFKF